MNIHVLLKSISRVFNLFIIFIFVLLLFSCRNKKEAFLFYNPDYYYVYDKEYKIYKSIRKKLNRNFYQVMYKMILLIIH